MSKKKISKKKLLKVADKGIRTVFDEDGNETNPYALESLEEFAKRDLDQLKTDHLAVNLEKLQKADVEDKEVQKNKVLVFHTRESALRMRSVSRRSRHADLKAVLVLRSH
jgi:hypothetical protein